MAQRGPAAGGGTLLSRDEAKALADRVLTLSTADAVLGPGSPEGPATPGATLGSPG